MAHAMLDDILAIPDHLRDALWRIDSARLEAGEAAGVLVCGMGGSAIGGDLAAAALGSRLTRPLFVVRGYRLPSWASSDWTVLSSSYSGNTEETLACFAAAEELGARRLVASTGGALVERARDAGVPVVGLPGILQPRAAVAYAFVVAAKVASLAGVAPGIDAEIETAAAFLSERSEALRSRAEEIAGELEGRLPIVCGADLTVPVARRWKTQVNENAKLPAYFSEIPEADHNELCGWGGAASTGAKLAAVFLEDGDQHPRERTRFELTAAAVAADGAQVVRVETEGDAPVARLLWAVMLGDLVSVSLAEARGVDPLPVESIENFKTALARS
ncbi:MAG TPA: bifunctional phosphoglucose/phosphomannose isomerase [Solirubrobacterales bacterium]